MQENGINKFRKIVSGVSSFVPVTRIYAFRTNFMFKNTFSKRHWLLKLSCPYIFATCWCISLDILNIYVKSTKNKNLKFFWRITPRHIYRGGSVFLLPPPLDSWAKVRLNQVWWVKKWASLNLQRGPP